MNRTVLFSAVLVGVVFFACSGNGENGDEASSSSSVQNNEAQSSSSNNGTQISSSSSGIAISSDSSSDSNFILSSSSDFGYSSSFNLSSSSSSNSSSSAMLSSSSSSSSPPVAISYPKLQEGEAGVQRGWNSRYWDGCRANCTLPENAWKGTSYDPNTENVPSAAFDMICKTCDKDNNEVKAYFWYSDWNKWFSNNSSCEVGPIPGISIYTCFDHSPIAINDSLAYAFAATPGSGDNQCGKCFQIQFTGEWANDPKPLPTHQALKGKTMIVMSSNIGHDVSGGQFDILIPGGGVGAFNSFSDQLGISADQLGNRMGGLLTDCDNEIIGWSATLEQWQTCLRDKCNTVFGSKSKLLLDGCLWQVDWYMAANNPSVLYKEVECPQYLIDKYRSTK